MKRAKKGSSSDRYSVLISVYNKENPHYYDTALASIASQTIAPNEIVIVEDGPLTDDLYRVTQKYVRKCQGIIKIVNLEENMVLGAALQKGILRWSNEIVFRMDADDISKRNRMERQLNIFKKYNVDIVGSNTTEFDEEMKKKTGKRIVPELDADIKKGLKKRNPMNHMTVAYRKTKVIEAGNYKDMPYFEDYYLWARMMKKGCTFYNIQDELVDVRGGRNMIKRRGGTKYIMPIARFETMLYRMKIISAFRLISNVSTRVIAALIPNSLRLAIYRIALREK